MYDLIVILMVSRVKFGFKVEPVDETGFTTAIKDAPSSVIQTIGYIALVDGLLVETIVLLPGDVTPAEFGFMQQLVEGYMAAVNGEEPDMPGFFTPFDSSDNTYLN